MRVSFTIPSVTPSLNEWQRIHRMKKTGVRTMFAWEVKVSCPREWPNPPPARVRVSITRIGRKLLDPDNLIGGCKPLIDGMRDAGVIRDDTSEAIELHLSQEQTMIGAHTRIELESIDDGHGDLSRKASR